MFEAKIIADSISQKGKRLTTFQLRYPRWVHGEFLTHRVFGRNSSSSRAIPVAKMIEQVRSNPAMPVHWGCNEPGMQANQELEGFKLDSAKELWLKAADAAAYVAEEMNAIGLHKQVANRILEPFQWMSTIVTATEFDNFYELRTHKDAQPEFQMLAKMMFAEQALVKPTLLKPNQWHLPYVTDEEKEQYGDYEVVSYIHGETSVDPYLLQKLSAARCARVSYLLHDGSVPDIGKDLQLYDRLVGSRPLHASPLEHQATPDSIDPHEDEWSSPYQHGNLVGWRQYRKIVEFSQA